MEPGGVRLVRGQKPPMVVDRGFLYWLEYAQDPNVALKPVATSGGTPEIVVPNLPYAVEFGMDCVNYYVVEASGWAPGRIVEVAR